MEPTTPSNVEPGAERKPVVEEQLGQLFGSYKAEWLREHLFELFTEPTYFPELRTPNPCVLVGGRGTGKTTALRCLSYEGQFALSGMKPELISTWPFYGMYYPVNTNRVAAFKGPEVDERQWVRLFAHYVNLELCELALTFLAWIELHVPGEQLAPEACREVGLALNVRGINTSKELASAVRILKTEFEASINNVADGEFPKLSLQGAPVDNLLRHMSLMPRFRNKHFFFLLDEYENFEDYQQQVVNTLVKHAREYYTFKIGVRELGWRRRTTLNANEQLTSPADYVRIDITRKLTEQGFSDFASAVCNARLKRLASEQGREPVDVAKIFPELTDEEEAEQLGVGAALKKRKRAALIGVRAEIVAALESLQPLEQFFALFWADSKRVPIADVVEETRTSPKAWADRYGNYKHAVLFELRAGKRGIRKHYAGWSVFTQLAAGNIRYLLELVDRALAAHLRDGGDIGTPIPWGTQTISAQRVGQKNLTELEGLSVHGARLTKLLLGLGRVFQVMAEDPAGHAPEVNQVHVTFDGDAVVAEEMEHVLKHAVMHLALVRFPGSKLQDPADTREYDYAIHPIFAPFFVFSHRRKRKMTISAAELKGLIDQPKATIAKVLEGQNRIVPSELPDQLSLFGGFYAGGT